MIALRDAFYAYHQSSEHSERTLEDIEKAIDHWERLTDNPPVDKVTNLTLSQFREALLTTPLPQRDTPPARSTAAKYLREIQAIFSTLGPPREGKPEAVGLIDTVPVCRKPRFDDAPCVTADDAEIDAIYRHCHLADWPTKLIVPVDESNQNILHFDPVDWWRALVVYLYNVGSRRNEFRSIRCEQIDLERKRLVIDPEKHGSSDWKPIHPVVVDHIRKIWEPERELLFASPNSPRKMYAVWYAIQEAAGIKVYRPPGSNRRPFYSFHEIRKTSGTMWAGFSTSAAQHMLGHKSIQTTQRYYVDKSKVAEKFESQIEQPSSFTEAESNPEPDDSQPATILFPTAG